MPAAPPGLIRRLSALFYDALLLLAVLFTGTALLLPFRRGQALGAGDPAYGAYLILLSFALLGWQWTHGGQTLGMRAWRLRLQSRDGGPVGWRQAAVRFSAGLLSLAALGLGFFWALVDRDRQCWHDRLAGTRLVWVGEGRRRGDRASGHGHDQVED